MKWMVALDQSASATAVLEKAVALARQQNADLVIYTVGESLMDVGDFMATGDLSEKIFESAKRIGEGYAAKAKALGLAAELVVEGGVSPADLILQYAEKNNIDLILLGSRAKNVLDRFLIGSIASKVVSHAHCSVLVLR